MIEGVLVNRLVQIHDERGKIMHMMSSSSPYFDKFGEIYFSFSHPGVVKAWHLHSKMTLNYAVVSGKLKLVLFDDRDDSPTSGQIEELYLTPDDHKIVTVPPGVWNGFKCVGNSDAILANLATIPHDPHEILRLPPQTSKIPYSWDIVHK